MLKVIRKGVDTIFVRILLGIIALSFVGFGGVTFMRGNSQGNVVEFSKTDSITIEEFMQAKQQKIDMLQKQNQITLTEEQLQEINIDSSVLQDLIAKAMFAYLAQIYDFDISHQQVINFVKKAPMFQNESGVFDMEIFKGFFRNAPNKEEEYLSYIKTQIINSTLVNLFMHSYKTPKIMNKNIVEYMAETKEAHIYKMDLTFVDKTFKPEEPSDEILEKMYQDNIKTFATSEKRSFRYIKVSEKFVQDKIKLDESELKQFYEENKEEFGNSFKDAEKNIRHALMQVRLEESLVELSKNLDDDRSNGMSLAEIATKYDIKVMEVSDMTRNAMESSKNEDLLDLASNVFEMPEGELSYPIEIRGKNEILMVELVTIKPLTQKTFAEVKDEVKKLWQKQEMIKFNINNLVKLREQENIKDDTLKGKGIVSTKKVFVRSDIPLEEEFRPEFLISIFELDTNAKTPIFNDSKYAYFAIIKNSKIDHEKAKKIAKEGSGHFENVIKENLMNELITYLASQNNIQVKMPKSK